MNQKGFYCKNKSHVFFFFITVICVTCFLAIHLIYYDVFMTPNLEYLSGNLSLLTGYLVTRYREVDAVCFGFAHTKVISEIHTKEKHSGKIRNP